MQRVIQRTKQETVYSRLSDIQRGSASDQIVDGCLVLEGGAFRGLYTQGFLDAMMQNDLNMSSVIGVSAGALGGMNYVSGQIGRSARINLGHRHDGRYVGAKAALHSRSLLDISFLVEERGILEPFDETRFFQPERTFVAVATNCLTGEPEYFEKGKCPDIVCAVRASATMPYISPMVKIGGVPYLDGGCACKIPYVWALARGYEKIIVIRTRDKDFRKEDRLHGAASTVYRKHPEFARRLARSNIDYNHQCDEIEWLHSEGRLLRMAPSEPVDVARLEGDMEKLGDLYWLGWNDCNERLDEMKAYLLGS